jgi:hypothetical protein
MLLLVWTTQFLFTARKARGRHINKRWFGLDHLSRVIAAILVVRAVQLHPIRRRPRRYSDRFNIRAGFRRRLAPVAQSRAIFGARLRKQFYMRDPFKRIGLLLNALQNPDTFASRIAFRARRGLNRLRAITPVRPRQAAAPPRLRYAVCAANSS